MTPIPHCFIRILFWNADSELYNAEGAHKMAEKLKENAKKRNAPQSDMDLLQTALEHVYVYVLTRLDSDTELY
jgi:hypothetical protein